MEIAVFFRTSLLDLDKPFFIGFDLFFQAFEISLKILALGIDLAFNSVHGLAPYPEKIEPDPIYSNFTWSKFFGLFRSLYNWE
jgi:hypothetical protein